MARKPLSKRTRFEVFKRDGFGCVYCGATPVQAVLHVDHVIALANGGTDDPDNLVTSCLDCNSGKAAVPLENRRFSPQDPERIRDHAQQIAEYLSLQNDVLKAKEAIFERLLEHWRLVIGPISPDTLAILRALASQWPFERLIEAMNLTARKKGAPGASYDGYKATQQGKYFSGILRKWRTEGPK